MEMFCLGRFFFLGGGDICLVNLFKPKYNNKVLVGEENT